MSKDEFIKKFMESEKPTSTDRAIPFLMKYIKEAHENNISFSREEIIEISENLCKDLPPKDRQQVQKAMKILKL